MTVTTVVSGVLSARNEGEKLRLHKELEAARWHSELKQKRAAELNSAICLYHLAAFLNGVVYGGEQPRPSRLPLRLGQESESQNTEVTDEAFVVLGQR
ncbi:MAG: hypothetical protein ACRDHZ_21585 [Ktedonobacteraceae bacterium]